ncbi:hypothetical protein CJ030_MR5G004894 [Morella rubra]|uniref:Uncharacterized protein n=1 Tax=Morella rubra TaxID=262757 RepID=A0A6A1VPR4_9ROSI|nr:hypothetical protein CJ030_MR5G004894 [Morella rubra]
MCLTRGHGRMVRLQTKVNGVKTDTEKMGEKKKKKELALLVDVKEQRLTSSQLVL